MNITRRNALRMAAVAAAPNLLRAKTIPLFDGKTLDGWIDIENSSYSLQGAAISDGPGFIDRVLTGRDRVSVALRGRLQDSTKATLTGFGSLDAKAQTAALSALGKEISAILTKPFLPDGAGAEGAELARRNKRLLEEAYPTMITRSPGPGWVVKDGVIASTGAGRGVLYTANDYAKFRLSFAVRHVSGNPDHQACVLIFCTRPGGNEVPLDALAGIQFQPPNGGRWDYRPSMNNNGGAEFTLKAKAKFNPAEWNRVEIVADASKGTASMSVNGAEMVTFQDGTAGKAGPIALQMHNAGLYDEYRDLTIEVDR